MANARFSQALPVQSPARLPPRDFWVISFSLAVMTLLSWIYLISMASDMASMENMGMAALQITDWSPGYFWMMFLMWSVMMVGMMVPSAAPMVLIYAAVGRKAAREGGYVASTGAFVAGYLVIWILFSFAATLMQWGLDKAALLSPMMVSKSPFLGAVLLVTAGIYQHLPVKNQCLTHCRSPFHFISEHWRQGRRGALGMGIRHGVFCLGCCWFLMLLLFVGGVMNLLWIAAITVFVLLEKVLPFGAYGGRFMGWCMIGAGVFLAIQG